jgi:PAS domain S-box-containing protein
VNAPDPEPEQWTERSSALQSNFRETETMFHLLFERSGDAILLYDPRQQVFVDCNQAAVAMMRANDKQQLLMTHPADLSPEFQPDQQSSKTKTDQVVEVALRQGSNRFEWIARRLDGTDLPMEVLLTPIQSGDNPLLATVCRDITERKKAEAALRESEERFRALFEHSADAMSLFDPLTGRFIESNEAVARQTGAPNVAALGNVSPAEISPERQPDGRVSSEKMQDMVKFAFGKGSYRFEWMARRYDGGELPLDVVLTPITYQNRRLLLAVSRDISDRKRAEQEILQLNASLEQRVAERTAELLHANEQLRAHIRERERQEKIQCATYQISDAVHTEDDLSSFYARVHSIVQTLMPARNFYIALLDSATQMVSFPYFVDEFGDEIPEPRPVGTGLTGVVLRAARPLLVDRKVAATAQRNGDVIKLSGIDVPYKESGRHAAIWLGAPLLSHGKAFGVMAVQDYTDEAAYRENEKQILTFVAEQTALAITRKQAEQALRDSEEQHRVLFEAASQGVMLHDEKAFLAVNPAAVRILGYTHPGQLIGKHPADLTVSHQPNGEESHAAARKHIERCLREGSTRFEWLAQRADGSQVMLDVLLTAMKLGGRDIIQAVIEDITERARAEQERRESALRLRESEARFASAFHASPVLIAMTRVSDGLFVEANDAFVRWVGLPREKILGRSGKDLNLWENWEDRNAFLERTKRDGFVRELEYRLRSHCGTAHTFLVSADIVEVNREPHLLTFGLDITERKQAEAELLKAIAREKELGQVRSKFVSMVSHEFRTPLAIIQSSAEILEDYLDQLEPAERQEHLTSIRNKTRHMAGLMEEVLLIGSIDAGRLEFKPAAVDLNAFVTRLVDEVLSTTDRRCPIDFSLPNTSSSAIIDKRLLQHILTNLLTNASKYSEAGQPVRMELKRDGTDLVSSIADQGIGIADADREWLFNAFHRGQNVGERPGTGLGLVIVKRCIDLHGGKIKIDSALGRGTTVTFRLPAFKS